jgi:hypothetical protein
MTLRYLVALLLFLLLGGFSAALAQQQTSAFGAVRGVVHDDAGNSVVGARVFVATALPAAAARVSAPPTITGQLMASANTDSTGAFVAFVPVGAYIACAQAPTQGLLDPCHWAASAPKFVVTANKTTDGVAIVMTHGAVVPIHVNDPLQLLAPITAPIQSDIRVQMVTGKGFRYEAVIVAHSSTSRDYAITIPYGAPMTLQTSSPNLAISTNAGGAAPSAGQAVTIPVGASAATFSFTVAGIKP